MADGGAIAGAAIAAMVGLLGLVISKEQKISEFRQAWIDGLRNDVAILIARANSIHLAYRVKTGISPELWEVMKEDFSVINESAARIKLRLNRGEQSAQEVCKTIEKLEAAFFPGKAIDQTIFIGFENKLVHQTQQVLTQEWRRVKKGESFFRIVQAIASAVAILAVLVFIAFVIKWIHQGVTYI